jgi:hypothetical protein
MKAVERHYKDLQTAHKRGFVFSPGAAQRPIDYVQKMFQHIKGTKAKQPLLLDDLRRVYAGLFASRGESPYMIGLPRCEIVPCHFSSEANQVGALYTYLQAESKTI